MPQITKLRKLAAFLLFSGVFLDAAPSEAGGFHINFFGGRRNGMLATLASPDDMTALFHNPAGLSLLSGQRVALAASVALFSNDLKLAALDSSRFPEINPEGCEPCPWPTDADGYYERSIEPELTFGALPFIGLSTDLSFVDEHLSDVVVGIAAYSPNFSGGVLPDDAPTAYLMTDAYFLVVAVAVGLGWRINRYVSVGFNASYNYIRMIFGRRVSIADQMTAPGEEVDAFARMIASSLGDVTMRFDGVDHGAGWTLSLLVRPTSWFSMAMVYSASMPVHAEGGLEVGTTRDEGMSLEDISALGIGLPTGLRVDTPIPPSLSFGLAFAPSDWLELGLDMRLWFYNIFERQRILPIYANDGDVNQFFTEEMFSQDKNFRLSYEISAGALFRYRRVLEMMVGVGYDQSPVPDETFSLDTPSLSMVLLSTGLRWAINRRWRIAATYMFQLFLPRDITSSQTNPPTNVRTGGHIHLPSLEVELSF